MYRKKVTQVLRTFNEREWRACYKFLKYCNKREAQGLKVFEYIYKFRKELKSPNLQASILRKKVIPEVSDRAFLNILSDLVKDVELFLMTDELQQKHRSYDQKKLISEIYKKRGLYPFFERTAKDMIKEQELSPTIDLFQNMRLLEVHHSLYFSDLYDKNSKPADVLIKADQYLNRFSANLNMYYDSEMTNLRSLFKDQTFEKEKLKNEDVVKEILERCQQLIEERDHSAFLYLEQLQSNNALKISDELSQAVLFYLINHCYYVIKSGDQWMIKNLGKLTLLGLNRGIFLRHGRFSETGFLNIVDTISKSGLELSFQNFIDDWIDKVKTRDPTSVRNIANALWSFGAKRYGDTLRILNSSEIHLTHGNLSYRARWMQICALCSEYPDYEEKEDVVKASLAFFKRHVEDMNDQTYKGSINLVNVIKMIWKDEKRSAIEDYIDGCDFIMNRSWINETLDNKESNS